MHTGFDRELIAAVFLLIAPIAAAAQQNDPSAATASGMAVEAPPATEPPPEMRAGAQDDSETLATIPVDPVTDESVAKAEPEKGPGNRLIEEIVVTAQKREQLLQDVPISIQAFSGEAIAARGIENTGQLAQSVPAMQVTNVAGFTLYYLRGIGTDQFIPSADPSIATYVDGIYIVQGQGNTNSLANIERLEVLKGPQGTLFGRNSTGGAISVITEEPGDQFKGLAEAEVGNFDSRSIRASVTAPITDWLAASVAGLMSKRDSYYEAATFEATPDETRAVRGKVNFHPMDSLSLSLTGYYAKQDSIAFTISENTEPSQILGTPGTGTTGGMPPPDDYFTSADSKIFGDTEQALYYGTLSWKLPWFDTKLLGSDQHLDVGHATFDFDGSPQPLATFDTQEEFIDVRTAELQILSNSDTWLSDRIQWVAGLYYFESEGGFDPANLRLGPQAFESTLVNLNLPLRGELADLVATLPLDNTPLEDRGLSLAFGGILGTESYSAYTQGTWFFNDFIDLTLGGRYQREKRFLIKSETGATNLTGGTDYDVLLSFPLDRQTATNFSPKAVISLHPSESMLLYLSYAVGYKSGTYNIINIYSPPNYIEPEEVTTYELGMKADFLDGNLRLNAAVFHNDIKDLQSGFVSILSGGAVRFLTAGGARTRGVEFDGTLVPMPEWNPGLALTANAAYVDAKYTDFTNGSGFDPDTGLYQEGLDFSGNRIVRSPKYTTGIGAVQAIDLAHGQIELAVDAYYNSGFYYDAYNTVEESSYLPVNARLSYLHIPWGLRLTVFGRNLFEERYHIQQLQTDFGVSKTLAPPREYGLRVTWQF